MRKLLCKMGIHLYLNECKQDLVDSNFTKGIIPVQIWVFEHTCKCGKKKHFVKLRD